MSSPENATGASITSIKALPGVARRSRAAIGSGFSMPSRRMEICLTGARFWIDPRNPAVESRRPTHSPVLNPFVCSSIQSLNSRIFGMLRRLVA